MEKSKDFAEEFISQMSKEIHAELKEKAQQEGRDVTFDDIEMGVLKYRQKIGEKLTNNIVSEQGTGKSKVKKNAKSVGANLNIKD